MPTATTAPSPSRWITLAGFLLLVIGGGMAIGYATRPDAWYAALAKPSFNPPNWLFAPVWTMLYVLVAIAGWRTWQRLPASATAMRLWALQLVLNFAWSPTFFGLHRVDLAFGVVVAMLASIAAFIAVSARRDRVSALLFAPYLAWVGFATLLNGAIWRLN
ncbi:MAG: tryptophan-rich sensory protein [Proteobacteria bacterium]|nr:tryptophan-rich sensory protein [Pseudomonadota bacterium]